MGRQGWNLIWRPTPAGAFSPWRAHSCFCHSPHLLSASWMLWLRHVTAKGVHVTQYLPSTDPMPSTLAWHLLRVDISHAELHPPVSPAVHSSSPTALSLPGAVPPSKLARRIRMCASLVEAETAPQQHALSTPSSAHQPQDFARVVSPPPQDCDGPRVSGAHTSPKGLEERMSYEWTWPALTAGHAGQPA